MHADTHLIPMLDIFYFLDFDAVAQYLGCAFDNHSTHAMQITDPRRFEYAIRHVPEDLEV